MSLIALESSKSEFGVTNSKYTLLKGLDDSQSFLGYVLSPKLSLNSLFTGGIMMNSKQL